MGFAAFVAGFIAWSQGVVNAFGYFGIFLISFIGSATIILPAPTFLAVFAAGSVLNPWLVGLFAGAGAAFGEITGYIVGLGGKQVIEKKHKKLLGRTKKWLEAHGAFPIIILFAATPLPDDIIGIICGAIKYNWKKFFLASFIGKLALNLALAWGGFYGVQWVLTAFGG